ncbi:1-deoxy-D-xylulose 5-phosphate reductoisomerase [Ruminococcaceae bacterium R-25]|nr:1-deoxy-D-xylulose 5-phosphate reductoisomerase [Ruminococcaceae bacterium R-25]SUQ11148.1 1-deoxy-D-xylulose 5-phosphate reductoisomerase [Oscillospiraceae bacterium]
MRKLSILGSTGSIGKQTLEVARKAPSDFTVEALSCDSDIDTLYGQIEEFRPKVCSVVNEKKALELSERLKTSNIDTEVLTGKEGNITIATLDSIDTIVGAIVGFAGLEPVYHAVLKGKDIALANKETLVAGGDIIMPLIKKMGVAMLPIDSEHSAIWQCLKGEKRADLDRILITASGGPFRGMKREDLENVTLEDALHHPTWNMGGKITIDSATMMNKGLEIIEAHHLYGIACSKIDVVVHPQSIIHSMIRLKDGSVLAQMGKPSMVLPIEVALYYPERGPSIVTEFDPFATGMNNLTFEPCDTEVFRLVKLAYETGDKGGLYPTVMNAANESAVWSYLKGKIKFLDIERTVFETVEKMDPVIKDSPLTIETIEQADCDARIYADEIIDGKKD